MIDMLTLTAIEPKARSGSRELSIPRTFWFLAGSADVIPSRVSSGTPETAVSRVGELWELWGSEGNCTNFGEGARGEGYADAWR